MFARLMFSMRMRWGWLPKGKPYEVVKAYTQMCTVGLLLGEDTRTVQELMRRLAQDGKHVRTLHYISSSAARVVDRRTVAEQRRSFSTKSLSTWGLLQGKAVREFLDQEYDLLINTSLSNCPYLEQVLRRSSARLKVGLCEAKAELKGYQLIVRSKHQAEGLSCAYAYLQHLQ